MAARRSSRKFLNFSLLLSLPILFLGAMFFMRAPWGGVQAQEKMRFPPPARGEAYPLPPELQGVDLLRQTAAEADVKSAGCVKCHQGAHDPHYKDTVRLGCTDCHGGDASSEFKEQAHVAPQIPEAWRSSANPV